MQASFLCGAHYQGATAQQHQGWPAPPSLWDAEIGQRTYDDFLVYAGLADEVGFDWISVSEHHYSPFILAPSLGPLAGALTQVVKRARLALLGPLAPMNNPVRIAEEIAMLDQLSHGRLIVLPLRGTPNEFRAYGQIDPQQTRGMTQEAALLIRKALAETEPFSWQGEHFQFQTVAVWPRTVQQPTPPMYFSGNGLESAAFAGAHRFGIGVSFMPPPAVSETVSAYHAAASEANWEPELDQIVYRGFCLVAETPERAADLAANFLPTPLANGISMNIRGRRGESAVPDNAGLMYFSGTPDVVAERIRAFHEATGVGVVDLIFTGGLTAPDDVKRSIELFGREVLPRIRDVGVPATARATAAGVTS